MIPKEASESSSVAMGGQIQSAHRRQSILTIVADRELPLTLSELADAVVEQAEPPAQPDTERVRTRLHHVDFPKLHERGMVEYNPSQNVVSGYL